MLNYFDTKQLQSHETGNTICFVNTFQEPITPEENVKTFRRTAEQQTSRKNIELARMESDLQCR